MDRRQQFMDGILFPDGSHSTQGKRIPRVANAKAALSVDLTGLRVLDLGCSNGYWSLYFAGTAREVVGLDYRPEAIHTGVATVKRLGLRHVCLLAGDIRDHDVLARLGRFDVVIAYGFLHRITDPFSFFDMVSRLAPCLWLEWRTPIFPGMTKTSIAYHSMNLFIDKTNLDGADANEEKKIDTYGDYGFWDMAPGAVANMARRVRMPERTILGYSDYYDTRLRSAGEACCHAWRGHLPAVLKRLLWRKSLREQFPRMRCNAIFYQDAQRRPVLKNGAKLVPPEWDYEMGQAWQ